MFVIVGDEDAVGMDEAVNVGVMVPVTMIGDKLGVRV